MTALVAFVHLFVGRKGNLSGVCIRLANRRAMEFLSMHFRPSSLRLPNGRKVVMAGTSSPPTLEDALRITPFRPSNVQGTVSFPLAEQEVKRGFKRIARRVIIHLPHPPSFRQVKPRLCLGMPAVPCPPMATHTLPHSPPKSPLRPTIAHGCHITHSVAVYQTM